MEGDRSSRLEYPERGDVNEHSYFYRKRESRQGSDCNRHFRSGRYWRTVQIMVVVFIAGIDTEFLLDRKAGPIQIPFIDEYTFLT